jgi:hypothetical protein
MNNSWHYQLMKHGEDNYAIHEYYNMKDGPAWTENAVTITGDSIEDVKKSLIMMLNDIDKHGIKEFDVIK